ncbi:MAG: RNA polymerase-binding protein DksA [Sulfurovum sp.]|nr:RNA polymerase-binding protein DksA [Sulfurovum sp.]
MESFKKDLLDRKAQIEKNLSGTFDEISQMRALDLNDEADYASVAVETEIDAAIMQQQRQELNEIELALGKIRDGSYGICEMCEDDISIERLNVKNFARYCITCREIIEKGHH